MNQLIKGVYLLTAAFFLACFFTIVGLQGISSVGVVLLVEPNASSIIFLFATVCIAIVLIMRLFGIYRQKKKDSLVAELLIGIYIFAAAWAVLQGLALIVDLTPLYLDWLFAKSVFVLISVLSIFIAYFYFEVYREGIGVKRNLMAFIIIIAAAIFYAGFTAVDVFNNFPLEIMIIFGSPTYASILIIIMVIIIESFKTARKVTSNVIATSFKFLGLGGLTLICSGILMVIINLLGGKTLLLTLEFIIFDASIYLTLSLAMIFLYIGFTYPIRKEESSSKDAATLKI